jgi:integrase
MGRLQELQQWADKSPDLTLRATRLRLAAGLRIVILTALRKGEVRAARCRDYDPESRMLSLPREKAQNANTFVAAGGHTPAPRKKWILSDDAHTFFSEQKASRCGDAFLFDPVKYKADDLSALIKQAASDLKWPDALDWSSLHTARHGGDQEIARRVNSDSAVAQEAVGAALAAAFPALPPNVAQNIRTRLGEVMQEELLDVATLQASSTRARYGAAEDARVQAHQQ